MRVLQALGLLLLFGCIAGCGADATTVELTSRGSCATYGSLRCLQVASGTATSVSVVTPFGAFSDVAVTPEEPAEVCFCQCVCAPGVAIGEAVVTTADGQEIRTDLGVGPMECCETM